MGNQRQVKETKGKSIKRRDRGKSKDIAGRRLRTRGQSSANRANAQYRQPPTASRRPARAEERPAPPRGRTFSQSPREGKVRAWKGDVSGYRMKRIRPSNQDAARSNVYPQKGPYVRYAQKRPKEKPPVYKRTIKGKRFVEHKPRAQERAWTGGLDRGPIRNQSATGRTRNTYSQRGPYVKYYSKRARSKSEAHSNRSQVAQVQRSRPPRTGGSQPRVYPSSRTKSYVQRGRKNVYWGKYQKKERPVTTDITGGPLRTRNYRSPVAGLVGRDSLEYFDRKPSNDRKTKPAATGYRTTGRASRGWKGDVAGWPVRSPRAQQDRTQKPLTPTQPGIGASWLSKTFNKHFRGVRPKDRRSKSPGAGYSGNIMGGRKGFGESGSGYSGNIKGGRAGFSPAGSGYKGNLRRGPSGFSRGGAGYSGNIRRRDLKGFNGSYVGYSGNVNRSALSEFSPSGFGYSGFLKRSQLPGMSRQGAGYSGTMRRGAGFSRQGADYSGTIKRRKGFDGSYIGYSGNLRRGGRGFSSQGANYTGNIRRGRGFDTRAAGYSGNIERVGAAKQFNENGVGYSGFMLWGPGFSYRGEDGIGKNKRGIATGFGRDGADFSGRTKAKRKLKGGGSVSGVLWNNEQSPLGKTPPVSLAGADFSGRTKAKRPLKGGGTVSGILWNNQESPLGKTPPASMAGADFSGRTKAKRPAKGGGSVSGILWNNQESAIAKSAPANAGAPAGLHVPVKEGNYRKKVNGSKESLPGVAPSRGSVKASEYYRNMKMYWSYKHNPVSARDARKTIGPGKAEARMRDYHGNTRMRKYAISGLHPDARFAHSEEDNVKAERGILTNVKVFWQKMFHKNGTQPTSVKDKGKKLQYDKREKGLWAY